MKLLFNPTKFHFSVWVWVHDLEDSYWHREKRNERPSQPHGTPLHYAALCGLDAIVEFLVIERSQDVHSQSFDHKSTALHLACRRGHAEVACFLLDNGADAEARDNRKSTPLHLASRGGHVGAVHVLLDRGRGSRGRARCFPICPCDTIRAGRSHKCPSRAWCGMDSERCEVDSVASSII